MTLTIAHRGDPARFRENTLPALRAAARDGVDLVGIDLRLTQDGHVVLMHDETLERFWRMPYTGSELTLAELAGLGDGRDRRIPTLMEVLAEFVWPQMPQLVLNVPSIQVALTADDVVRTHGMLDQVLYNGSIDAMRALRARRPHARLMLTWAEQGLPPAALWQAVQPTFYDAYWPLLDPDVVARVHRYGCAVSAWTVNDVSQMVRLIEMGVDAISTDQPADLTRLLASRPPRRG
ncbi:glycerophosphodiester phosphodiesterase [Nocardiopsis ansamitocini]|uniref:Glycerophosphoryl diester phosphodiesterase n=1 Tax=Nocardiopsis ansamitocini TaxID=1670832 RepID=A0A9W6P3B1_9ACTN|nr:glycerophosphodiester phosphodiesterase [Nocardiopsis ansamitocini]GLU46253.1 glycerophosphoryl diester phosphodiesterase [Nocardiopsis ansamitocini]